MFYTRECLHFPSFLFNIMTMKHFSTLGGTPAQSSGRESVFMTTSGVIDCFLNRWHLIVDLFSNLVDNFRTFVRKNF